MALKRPSCFFWMLYLRLRNAGRLVNHKCLNRLYEEAILSMRRKSRKRFAASVKQLLVQAFYLNLPWSMDFMKGSLFQGVPFRAFNVIDVFNREALNITVAKIITARSLITAR
jgi:putative transposase